MPNAENITGKNRSRGRPFTPETAREARQRRTAKEKATASVTEAFKRLVVDMHKNANGQEMQGADIIAQSIMQGCINGNAKLIEMALSMLGEKPRDGHELYIDDPVRDLIKRWDDAANESE